MATYAQLAMAGQEAQDRSAFESSYDKEGARRTKAGKWGGWGRTLGLLGTAGLIASTGGLAGLPLALKAGLVGLGGLAGRSGARAMAGGRERDADKNVDALFYQGEQRKFGKEIGDYQAGMRERMLTDAGRDAFSAYLMGGAGEKIAKWGADKPKMMGDWGARNIGLGGDQFAAETTAKGLADNPWLAGASEADDLWASGVGAQSGSVAGNVPTGSVAGNVPNFQIMTTPENPMGIVPESGVVPTMNDKIQQFLLKGNQDQDNRTNLFDLINSYGPDQQNAYMQYRNAQKGMFY